MFKNLFTEGTRLHYRATPCPPELFSKCSSRGRQRTHIGGLVKAEPGAHYSTLAHTPRPELRHKGRSEPERCHLSKATVSPSLLSAHQKLFFFSQTKSKMPLPPPPPTFTQPLQPQIVSRLSHIVTQCVLGLFGRATITSKPVLQAYLLSSSRPAETGK